MKAFFRNLKRCVQRLTAKEETYTVVLVSVVVASALMIAVAYATDRDKFEKCEGDVQCELNTAIFEGLFKIN